MSKHTPGEWSVSDQTTHYDIHTDEDNGSTWIAEIPAWKGSVKTAIEAKANASLIAQAPAMLEALKDVRTTLLTEAMLNPSYGWKEWVEERINPIIRAAGGGE